VIADSEILRKMEKRSKYQFLMILILLGVVYSASAQTIIVRSKDGTESDKTLNSLRKFSFVDNNLQMSYTDGSTETYSISDIEKLYFNSLPVGVETIYSGTTGSKIELFPNPAQNSINLKNITEKGSNVQIFRMDGVLVQQYQIDKSVSTIDISRLSRGFYLMKINNQALKFMKL
jgi:hypothetical protein